MDKALDALETGIARAEDVEAKLTMFTCVKEKMLAVTNACVVILRPACGPLAKILGVSACDSRSTIGQILPHRQQQCVPSSSLIRSSHSCIVPARMQVVLNGVARSCSAIHVCGTDLFLKIERCMSSTVGSEYYDKDNRKYVPSHMNGETFYLFVGTMAYGALGVLIAFAGT